MPRDVVDDVDDKAKNNVLAASAGIFSGVDI
jgi:hypothetical protein